MKNKLYLILCFTLLLFTESFSQSITVQVRGDDLYYNEPGCFDCWVFSPDPVWNVKITTPSGPYSWNASQNEYGCGWGGGSNGGWVAPQTQLATATLTVSFDGYESDGFICGADDNVCGGSSPIGSVVINSNPPCQWNQNNYQRVCGSGTYAVKWSYFWSYQTILPGSIVGVDTLCAGGDPLIFTSGGAGSPFVTYQWQSSVDSGTTWTDIPGATGLTYDPPAGLPITTWYKRVAKSCGGAADTATNVVVAFVHPNPIAIFLELFLPGQRFKLLHWELHPGAILLLFKP